MKKKICQILLLLGLAFPSLAAESYDYQRGNEAYNNGDYDEAIEYFIKDLSDNPTHVEGYAGIASACSHQGNLSKAIGAMNMAKPYCKSKSDKVLYYYMMGQFLAQAGDTVTAIDNYSQAIKLDSKAQNVYYNRADLYASQNKCALAEADFRKIADLRNHDIESQTILAALYVKQKRWNDVLTGLSKLEDTDTVNYLPFALRSEAYYNLKQYDKMAEDLTHSLSIAGLNDFTYASFQEVKSPSARMALVNQMKKHFETDKSNSVWPFLIGRSYEELDSFAVSTDYYHKALALYESGLTRMRAASNLYNMGFIDLALDEVQKCLENDSSFYHIDMLKAKILRNAGRYAESLNAATDMITQAPDDCYGYSQRGYTYERMELTDSALADYNTALIIKPDSKYTAEARGLLYWQLGDTANARLDFENTVDFLAPERETVDTASIAFCLYYLGKKDEARKYIDTVLSRNDRGDIFRVASFYAKEGQTDAAFSTLKLAFEKGYRQIWMAENDKNLVNVRKLSGFKPLIDEYKQKLQQEEADYRAKHNLPAKVVVSATKQKQAKMK